MDSGQKRSFGPGADGTGAAVAISGEIGFGSNKKSDAAPLGNLSLFFLDSRCEAELGCVRVSARGEEGV